MDETLNESSSSRKRVGRQKGVPNAISGQAKENIAAVFVRLGGTAAMARWAKRNQSEFYTRIYPRILPHELTGVGGGPIRIIAQAEDAGVL